MHWQFGIDNHISTVRTSQCHYAAFYNVHCFGLLSLSAYTAQLIGHRVTFELLMHSYVLPHCLVTDSE